VPFERLVDHLRPPRDPARAPLFQVMCNGQDTPRHDLSWPGVEVTGEQPEPGVSKYDLTLDVHQRPGGLLLDLEFNRDVFDTPQMTDLLDRVVVVLDWLTDDTRPLFGDEPPRPAPQVDRITAPKSLRPAGVEPRDDLEALVLGADKGVALTSFQTPLATLFKFQGWADKFLTTPANGVRDLYGSVGYGVKQIGPAKGVTLQAVYHRFESDRLKQHQGNELDLLASAKFGKTLVSVRYADYDADKLATDAHKLWLQLDWIL